MLLLILLLVLRFSRSDTCPIFCQCYSAFDGYHVTCQNAGLDQIPYNLTKFLQTTTHQNLIVDLTSNFLSTLPCNFFQISTIITLILTKNRIEYLPSCFSQSSIENLLLNFNHLQFNQTTILSSSKLLHLDISSNKFTSLPETFFFHLRRLRRLIINDEIHLFQFNNDQWIRSLTTHNQLTIIICNDNLQLPLCLLDNLFQTKKLLSIELNSKISCDCSFVYLPIEKIHFHYCQSEQQQGICDSQSSRFEQGHSLTDLQNSKYRQICLKEYQNCQLITNDIHLPLSKNLISLITKKTSINQSTIVTEISPKKENITVGAIIPLVLVLIILTIVCLYVILSGHLFKSKNRKKISEVINRKKNQQDISSRNSMENLNMNSFQRRNSDSDDQSELTFYSIHNAPSTFIQSSTTEIDIQSLTSTIHSSISNETVIISNRNKPQRIY